MMLGRLVVANGARMAAASARNGRLMGTLAHAPEKTPLATDVVVKVTLVDEDGRRHLIHGFVGQRLTYASMMNGMGDLLQEEGCGGSEIPYQVVHNERYTQDTYGDGVSSNMAHVIVAQDWFNKLPAMLPDEDSMLNRLDALERGPRTPQSRIASEIVLTKELDGLEVYVPDAYPSDIP